MPIMTPRRPATKAKPYLSQRARAGEDRLFRPEIMDLGSRAEGWIPGIARIFEAIGHSTLLASTPVLFSERDRLPRRLRGHLTSLRFVFLAPPTSLDRYVTVVRSHGASSKAATDEAPYGGIDEDPPDELFGNETDNDGKSPRGEREDDGPDEDAEEQEEWMDPAAMEAAGESEAHDALPEPIPIPDDVESTEEPVGRALVHLDLYGLYTPSAHHFLATMASGNVARQDAIQQALGRVASAGDGPAIVLFPEKIRTIPPAWRARAGRTLREWMGLDVNLEELACRMVLLHELGHHVFPGHDTRLMSEAAANWFAFGLLGHEERWLQWLKASWQRPEYRAYQMFFPTIPLPRHVSLAHRQLLLAAQHDLLGSYPEWFDALFCWHIHWSQCPENSVFDCVSEYVSECIRERRLPIGLNTFANAADHFHRVGAHFLARAFVRRGVRPSHLRESREQRLDRHFRMHAVIHW